MSNNLHAYNSRRYDLWYTKYVFYCNEEGNDYSEGPTTNVTFLPNQTSAVVRITINSDNLDENNETFIVGMIVPSQAEYRDRILFSRQNTTIEIVDSNGTYTAL